MFFLKSAYLFNTSLFITCYAYERVLIVLGLTHYNYYFVQVHRLCGYASKGRPSPFNDFAAANPPSIDFPMVPNPSVPLDERLLDFVESLDKSRGVYQNLPMMMCMDGELGSTGDQACWTGQTVGE